MATTSSSNLTPRRHRERAGVLLQSRRDRSRGAFDFVGRGNLEASQQRSGIARQAASVKPDLKPGSHVARTGANRRGGWLPREAGRARLDKRLRSTWCFAND